MIPTHFLFQLAEYEGIKIEWANLTNIKGLYLHTPTLKSPVIALAHSLHNNERKLRCVLAHELGHHFKTAGHHTIAANYLNSVYATKNELSATKWAVNFLVDTEIFLECINDQRNAWDLSDYFYVTKDFIDFKWNLLKEMEGIL